MRNNLTYLGLGVMFAFAIYLRYAGLHFISMDMSRDFIPWYHQLADGGYKALIQPSFSYTPPYLYLLLLATSLRPYLSDIVVIKLIPIFFDVCNAFLIYKIVRIRYPLGKVPILAAAILTLAPTVILNGAYWGQVDGFYTCFLLACLYFMLKDKPLPALLFFGIAFAIKAQAVFMGPFLALMFFKKHIHWSHFGMIPIVYLIFILPMIIIGKPVFGALTVYAAQAGSFQQASMNAPNPYIFIRPHGYTTALIIGLSISAILVLIWLIIYARRKYSLTHPLLVLTALVSVACIPFILPKMHDRYFYPADIFSILLAFFIPELWFVAIGYQLISVLAYSIFLFHQSLMPNLVVAAALNTSMVIILLWKQYQYSRKTPEQVHQ
jgi:Gpi18-like mannosyltransferase